MSNNADMKDYEAVALSLLLDDSGSEGEELSDVFYNAIINLSEADLKFQTPNLGEVRNANGSLRKVKRLDYSRGPKRIKTADPWTDIYWLELISDPTTNDPSHRNGKECLELHSQFSKRLWANVGRQMILPLIMNRI